MSPATALYDLHLHTSWSYDATAGVEAYFAAASRCGVRCLAITDHHLTDGWGEVRAAARAYPGVRAIPSADLTVTTEFGAIDLLCYGLPETAPPARHGGSAAWLDEFLARLDQRVPGPSSAGRAAV